MNYWYNLLLARCFTPVSVASILLLHWHLENFMTVMMMFVLYLHTLC